MSQTPFESPAEDVAEQRTEVLPDGDPEESSEPRDAGHLSSVRLRWDADPADAQEQQQEVPSDEDEWR